MFKIKNINDRKYINSGIIVTQKIIEAIKINKRTTFKIKN